MRYSLSGALKRTVTLTRDDNRKGILIRCMRFGPVPRMNVPVLEKCAFPRDTKRLMDAVIENHLRWRDAHEPLEDDYLPALMPFLGIAEHSCFLGGNVRYGGNTSYQEPALENIADFRSLRCDETRPHYKLLMDCMEYLKEKSQENGFFVSLRGFDGPMDIANAIRGNDLLYDLYDNETESREFINYCAEGCLWTYANQRRYANEVEGGYFSGQGLWMPGNAIGHMSEDASTLCSPSMYETFGLPATRKVLDNFDFASLHVHSLGRKCIPIMRKLEKFKLFQLTDDPNQPTGLDVYKEYERELDGVLVNVDLTARDVRENLAFLKKHRTVVNLHADSVEEARAILELVRETD